MPCHHLIINQVLPEPEEGNSFWKSRYERQAGIISEIEKGFPKQNRYYYGLQAKDIRGVDALGSLSTISYKKAQS